jgi:prepilin-type N-terminal cleavage/methylation domain-containing protein
MTKYISTQISDKVRISIFPSRHRQSSYQVAFSSAFTIVELLVVIVVIGILAAITIVSYTGVTQKATTASLQSDLTNASQQLKLYYVDHGTYPTSLDGNNCPLGSTAPSPDTNYCLKVSSGNTIAYTSLNPQTFRLADTKGTTSYSTTDATSPTVVTTAASCPSGFIPVPGSGTYGTSDFCVMKYAASQVGSTTTPISQAGTTPWVNISQTTAIANSPNVAGCTGCHLITEAEYMTIAQNVLSVASNWSGGSVGSGYIYSGHNDNAPANALAPDSNDANGYYGETNQGGNQRRTLALTNGQVIWDIAGNVWEWTSGQTTGGQPGVAGNAYASWIQWPNVTTPGTLSPNVFPSGTGITGSSAWTSTQGIGQLLSNPAEASLRGFLRGGGWYHGSSAGVLTLHLSGSPSDTGSTFGFRVSR